MQGARLVAVLLATGVGASAATVTVVRVGTEPRVVEVSSVALQGERGPQGPPGKQGLQGVVGMQGEAGVDGVAGKMGAVGPRGARGLRGIRGNDGAQGPVGATGPAGATGEKGETGSKGDTGASGPAGVDGAIGIAGLPGEKGDTGPQGDKGETGATGPAGPKGDPGGFGAYGSFYDTTDVPLTLGAATPVPLNQTEFASGVSVVNGSEITVAQTGRYNIAFSIQLEKTDAGTDWVSIWLRKNGDNVPWTNTDVALSGSDANSRTVVAWNFFVVATAAGDQWQLMIASTTSATGKMLIQSVDPQVNPVRPAIPGTILTVNQVG